MVVRCFKFPSIKAVFSARCDDRKAFKSGFTLIELAIVLVVIGLLFAMIPSYKGLKNNNTINTLASDYQRYRNAAMNFKAVYGMMPGDVVSAKIKGLLYDSGGTAVTTYGANFANAGDNIIAVNGTVCEACVAMRMLKRAFPNTFSVIDNTSTLPTTINLLSPTYSLTLTQANAYFESIVGSYPTTFYYLSSYTPDANNLYTTAATNGLILATVIPGSVSTAINTKTFRQNITTGLDVKIDDGVSYTGTVFTDASSSVSSCVGAAGNKSCNLAMLIAYSTEF